MCGICGIINLNKQPVQESSIKLMMNKMQHRGPDDEGLFIEDYIGLGFKRLSIIDLSSAGHQPMISNNGRYIVIMNGEIFNYIEIRAELKDFYVFKSNTDTEVLLASYIKWGPNCLEKLNGMFAFVIYDIINKCFFAARDRFGIKPFYYYLDNNRFIFASDIPPILEIYKSKKEPNNEIIFDYLVFNRTNHCERTFFKNILKLQHGHYITIKNSEVRIDRWYELSRNIELQRSTKFDEEDFLAELKKSINLQLRSDVPVGTCLSGGLDSSTITSLVLENKKNIDLHSFSAVYIKGQRGDESEYISEYKNDKLKIHFTFPTDITLLEEMDYFINSLSEPVPSTSIYAEYKVMELAKKYCTVLLNGQGADEILAGYHYFYGYYFKDLIKDNSWIKFLNELYHYYKNHKNVNGLKYMFFSFYPRAIKHYRNYQNLNADFFQSNIKTNNILIDEFYSSKTLKEFLIKHFEYKFEHNLIWADKTGMAFSLETRFPFLDHLLVEKTLSLSSERLIKKGYNKVIMREALQGILPEKIRMRKDKIGFETPQDDWFKNNQIQALLKDIVYSDSFRNRGYFNINQCKSDIDDLKNHSKRNAEFWKWINLEIWFRHFID